MKNLVEKSHFSQKIMKMGLLFQLPIHVSMFMSELLTFCFVIQKIGSPCSYSPVLRSVKRAPANVRRLNNRKWRQRYCLVGERSRALALLNAALTCLIINKRQMDFEKACEMGWIGKACHDVGRWTRVTDWVLYTLCIVRELHIANAYLCGSETSRSRVFVKSTISVTCTSIGLTSIRHR